MLPFLNSHLLSGRGHPLRSPKVNYSLFRSWIKRSHEMASRNKISNAVFNHYLIKDKIELSNLLHTLTAQQSQLYGCESRGAFTGYLQSKRLA